MEEARSRRLLQLSAASNPLRPHALVKVLELDRFHILPRNEVKIYENKDLWTITLNKRQYHAVIVQTGDPNSLQKLMLQLLNYERVATKYKHLSLVSCSSQTEDIGLESQSNKLETLHELQTPDRDLDLIESEENVYHDLTPVSPQIAVISNKPSQDLDLIESEENVYHDQQPASPQMAVISNEPPQGIMKAGKPTSSYLSEADKSNPGSDVKTKSRSKKKHFCKFCKKLVGNFSRHIKDVHCNEEEVKMYMNIKNKQEKLDSIRKIMADGDLIHNTMNPQNPIVRRVSASSNRATCPKCKQLFSKKHAVTHLRKCNPDSSHLPGASLRVQLYRESLKPNEILSDDMKNLIIPLMRNDSIRRLCENDQSLILYGNKMCERLKGGRQEKTIRNHLRILGRVCEQTLNKNPAISSVSDIFDPKHYNSFVNAIYEICGYGKAVGEEMEKPTTPHQYGPKMKELSDVILTELLKKVNPALEDDPNQISLSKEMKKIESWQAIYKRDFDKQVASLGRKQADRRTFESKNLTPTMDDVQKLLAHIEEKKNTSYQQLKVNFEIEAYKTLCKSLLLKLWIFNRRRVGEVDDMELKSWLAAKDIDEASEQFKSLNSTEQHFASSFRRICVISKLRRPAALLVAKKDNACYELLISLREKAGITKENVYLFAVNEKHIEGTGAMKEFAKACGAKNWMLLTGTRLQKQLAASLRYLNLTDEDLRLVAESMGHTEKTQLTKYRTHDPAIHAGRMGKVLMAMDDGKINDYRGMSIDELDDIVAIEPSSQLQNQQDTEIASTSQNVHETYKRKLKFDDDLSDEELKPSRGNTPGRKRSYAMRKVHKKNRLPLQLKEAIQAEMAEEIKERTCPSTARVLQAIATLECKFPSIVNHSPKKLKSLVSNWSKGK